MRSSNQWGGWVDGMSEMPDATRPTTSSLAHINSMKGTHLSGNIEKLTQRYPEREKQPEKGKNTAATNTI